MTSTPDQAAITHALPGVWALGASNLADWTDGARRDIEFRFEVEGGDPLVVLEEQSFTGPEGRARLVAIVSRLVGGSFVSKGRGLLRGGGSRWTVGGLGPDGAVMVLRILHPRGGQDGLLVLVRRDAGVRELRSAIAMDAARYGIGPEDFASLTWLELVDRASTT
jgi:hypothetical protein